MSLTSVSGTKSRHAKKASKSYLSLFCFFRIARPNGVPMVADFRKLDNTHRTTVQETGDYRICFDNVHHSFSSKTVYFEVIIESGNDEEDDFDPSIYGGNVFKDAEEYDMKVEDIEHKLRIIKEKISQSRHFQDQIRAHELRDRSVAEHNFERINFWSFLHVFALLSASLIQVLVVKSLFDEKSKLRTLWNKIF